MDQPLLGRRIIVTGAATGIGRAAVTVFAAAGADVAATHHTTPPPPELAEAARWFPCDVRDRAAVDATFAAMAESMGGLDVLLHAAGLWLPSTPDDLTEDELDFLLATNVKATVFANQAAFRHLRDHGGRILNLGSCEAATGNPFAPIYALTKGAVHAWTRTAARAWGRHGITVNSLAPAVETPGADRVRAHVGPEGAAALEQQIEQVVVIGGRLGDPVRDLGPMLVFMAGEGSRFITGQLLAVDGGVMMVGA